MNTRILAFLPVLMAAPLAMAQAQSVPQYTINTVAGNNGDGSGYSGDSGPAVAAQLSSPIGVTVDKSGNIFISDQNNNVIREVTTDGNINTVAGNQPTPGYGGDGGSALGANAAFKTPAGIGIDGSGNLYVADLGNDVIRKFSVNGNLSTVAGNNLLYLQGPGGLPTGGFSGDNALAINALLNIPYGVAADSAGNVYIADMENNRIREATVSDGKIRTIAGNGTQGTPGSNTDVGSALSVHLNFPHALAVGANGIIYIADTNDHRVLKLSGGAVTLVAGTGVPGYSGDGGPASKAQLQYPRGVAVDSVGNVYIADYTNHVIRFVSAVTGNIYTIAGVGRSGYSGDAGPATSAQLSFPSGVAVDSKFNVYVADTQNNVIRQLTPSAPPQGIGGSPAIRSDAGVITAGGYGCLPTDSGCGSDGVYHSTAQGSWIEIYGSNLAPPGDSRTWNSLDFTGNQAPNALDLTTVSIGNQAAFVSYISPTQVNALVPSTVGLGPQPVTVSTAAGASNSFTINVAATQPLLLALPQWTIDGKHYVTAVFPSSPGEPLTYVGPVGAFPGVTSRPAKPGETIVLYGIGFGQVSGGIPAGQLVQQYNTLLNSIHFSFGGAAAATPGYYGLAPSQTGLYQFNVTVPTNVTPGNAVPLTFTFGPSSVAGSQTLYTAVQ